MSSSPQGPSSAGAAGQAATTGETQQQQQQQQEQEQHGNQQVAAQATQTTIASTSSVQQQIVQNKPSTGPASSATPPPHSTNQLEPVSLVHELQALSLTNLAQHGSRSPSILLTDSFASEPLNTMYVLQDGGMSSANSFGTMGFSLDFDPVSASSERSFVLPNQLSAQMLQRGTSGPINQSAPWLPSTQVLVGLSKPLSSLGSLSTASANARLVSSVPNSMVSLLSGQGSTSMQLQQQQRELARTSFSNRGGRGSARNPRMQTGRAASAREGSTGLGSQEFTVEDLLRVILMLPPGEKVTEVAEQGLPSLDSSATAALLKELSKQGHVKRAFEIFDWLRTLPTGHPLSLLCDLYTYTTMIAQCGSQQQLRKALDLVAEMKARSITCNVHTYSALMNVCMKANELDVALDVFQQMQQEGVHPNLVTYNILIDVHVRKGQWDEAIGVLHSIQQQGIHAEARTYNAVISACSKAGQYERALAVYNLMKEAGVEPSTTTYTAMIGVFGRVGHIDKCLEVYQEMVKRGCERNVITYSSLIGACEKAGQWQVALELYDIMRQEGCRPNTVTFNSLILACAHGCKWQKAAELFDQMPTCSCKPDACTYGALISVYERCGQWLPAMSSWEMMQVVGFHPDAVVYYSLLEALWQSGIVLAQARALQLWVTANRTGQIRIYTNSNNNTHALQYSMVTPKPGVAVITVLCWLLELRSKLVRDASTMTTPYQVVVTLQRARANRPDAPPSQAAHEAVRCLLLGASCPFQLLVQPTSTLLTANSDELLTWLQSNHFTDLTNILQVASVRQWTAEAMHLEDSAIDKRCQEAYQAVSRLETHHSPNPTMYNLAVLQQRPQVVNLAIRYGSAFHLKDETIYDGLALFDRVMTCGATVGVQAWPLCLCCCLLMCAHQSEAPMTPAAPGLPAVLAPWQSYETVEAVTGFNAGDCNAMERNIYVWLNGDITVLSPLRVLLLYQERLGYFLPDFKSADRTTADLPALITRIASSLIWLQIRPSLLAAGLLATLRHIRGILPVWPTALKELSGLSEEQGELPACMLQVENALSQY